MRLIVVRHGQTEWNLAGREIGQLDAPLTELGVRQAEAIAARLARASIAALYTSDLGRAVGTAERIAAACELTPRPTPDLRERRMGVLEGLTRDDVRQRYPDLHDEYERNGYYATIPEGESVTERRRRALRAMTAIAEDYADATVVAVTHSGLLAGFVEAVLDLPMGHSRHFTRGHCSFNSFGHESGAWRLVTWNDVSHLEGV